MKVIFITSAVYPSPTANRIHILSMARAFAKKGVLVHLLCQKISNANLSNFVIKEEIGTNRSITSAWRYANFLKKNDSDFWFVREPHLMFLTIIFYILKSRKLPPFIIYEVHDLPRDYFDSLSLKLLKYLKKYHIIVITKLLKDDLTKEYDLPEDKVEVLSDGVDTDLFNSESTKENIFEHEKPQNQPLVVYTGSLFRWKGVYTLIETAKLTPEINFWIIGGYKKDIEDLSFAAAKLNNVRIWGHISHENIAHFLRLADVLVLPNSATYKMSERYTSPLKLFEYMATGKPIVASRLPSIEEIIKDGVNGYLVEPDNSTALKNGIERALSDPQKNVIMSQAVKEVAKYTWDVRVEKILMLINRDL